MLDISLAPPPLVSGGEDIFWVVSRVLSTHGPSFEHNRLAQCSALNVIHNHRPNHFHFLSSPKFRKDTT